MCILHLLISDKLTKLIMDQEIHFRRLQNNENLMIVQPRKNKERNLNIVQAQTDLITGRYVVQNIIY